MKKIIISILVFFIKLYQNAISPYLGANKCRYIPTCSEYAIESITKHGIVKGLWLGTKRLFRCTPWGNHGFDPVP